MLNHAKNQFKKQFNKIELLNFYSTINFPLYVVPWD